MNWITENEVKRYATTPKRTLYISIKHWKQIVDATAAETRTFSDVLSNGLFGSDLCGLCVYYERKCNICPLAKSHSSCKKNQYKSTLTAFYNWRFNRGHFQTFKKEARKMLRIIEALCPGDSLGENMDGVAE